MNDEQIRYWNEVAGPKWVSLQNRIDEQIRPVGEAAIDRASVREGEDVLDVGCGCGDQTIALAKRIGETGTALGIDISEPMLARATERAREEGCARWTRFERVDAQGWNPPEDAFDLVFSRFGVMFFEDPVAAFRNFRRALRPSGRLVFVCWQPIPRNPWVLVPLEAIVNHVALPSPPGPEEPGPFSFGDPDRVRRILGDAGFDEVALEEIEPTLSIGGTGSLDDAADFLLDIGPGAAALREAPDPAALRPTLLGIVREALEPFASETGVHLAGACWIVSAS